MADRPELPPEPLAHVSVNVVVADNGPTASEPEVALLPVQPPDAVQEAALVVLQDNVLVPWAATVVGAAVIVTLGSGVPPLF